jgi:hypothetical protein
MSIWPGNPVASMRVDNFHGGSDSSISVIDTALQRTVSDIHIDFAAAIEYHDHPLWEHGQGFFSLEIDRLDLDGTWHMVATQSKTLGDGSHDGDWYDSLTASVTMVDVFEQYQIKFHCQTRGLDPWIGGNSQEDMTGWWQAVQGSAFIGSFTLEFVPVSIVYCPPGQDMTNSLTQSDSYGTRFTIGFSNGMQTQVGVQQSIDVLGLFGEGVGYSDSQYVTNASTTGIEVSHFRNTVLTADNHQAIGRAYWGPLGDIFAILMNPTFNVNKRADGTLLYSLSTIEQVLQIPAYKLLRPNGDPIASLLLDDVRKGLLQLDPFITNLELFFPDSGADLAQAANPYNDPSADNRAELIGIWWPDAGTELNYSIGNTYQLFSKQSNEVDYSSTVTINAMAGAYYDGIKAGLDMSASNTVSVGFQRSKEADASSSKSAACFLIRNQNDRDLDGIAVYFDKVFSTFMFQRLTSPYGGPVGILSGAVFGYEDRVLRGLNVSLVGQTASFHTSTTVTGEYRFYNVPPGEYMLTAGDARVPVTVPTESGPIKPIRMDLRGVRRAIDLRTASVWEACEALGVSSDVVRRIGSRLPEISDLETLARVASLPPEVVARWRNVFVLSDGGTRNLPIGGDQ